MSRIVSILDKATAIFFMLGAITSKMTEGFLPLLAPAFKIFSAVSFLLGFSLWYVSALIQKDAPRKPASWYGFAEFKQQFQMAALLGIIATALYIVIPSLMIPVAWMYVLSNIIWSIGEYHKKNMPPPDDASFSTVRQSIFWKYTVGITLVSLFSAASVTVTTFFPLTIPIVIPLVTGLCVTTLIVSTLLMGRYLFGKFTPDQQNIAKPVAKPKSSTTPSSTLDTKLAPSQTQQPQQPSESSKQEPKHFPSPTASSAAQSPTLSPVLTPLNA